MDIARMNGRHNDLSVLHSTSCTTWSRFSASLRHGKNWVGRRDKMQELEPPLLNGHFTHTPAARPAAM